MNLDVIICGAFVNGKPIGLIKDLLKALSNYSFSVHLVKEREFREKTLNEGMKFIGKRDLLILGDDITLTDGWLQSLNKYKAKGDIIGFSMLYPNTKKIENTGYDIVQVDERITLIARNRGKDIRDIKEFNYTSCDAISGCAMFIKKEVFDRKNLFSIMTNSYCVSDEMIKKAYEQARFSLLQNRFTLMYLSPQERDLGIRREIYLAKRIYRIYKRHPKKMLIHISGWEHLVEREDFPTLFSLLKKLNPSRILLGEDILGKNEDPVYI